MASWETPETTRGLLSAAMMASELFGDVTPSPDVCGDDEFKDMLDEAWQSGCCAARAVPAAEDVPFPFFTQDKARLLAPLPLLDGDASSVGTESMSPASPASTPPLPPLSPPPLKRAIDPQMMTTMRGKKKKKKQKKKSTRLYAGRIVGARRFPHKLVALADNPSFDTLTWTEAGSGMIMHNVPRVAGHFGMKVDSLRSDLRKHQFRSKPLEGGRIEIVHALVSRGMDEECLERVKRRRICTNKLNDAAVRLAAQIRAGEGSSIRLMIRVYLASVLWHTLEDGASNAGCCIAMPHETD